MGTHAHRPLAAVARIAKDRELQRFGELRRGDQEARHGLESLSGHCAHQRHRRSKLPCQGKHVHLPALLVQLVGHVEQDQRGQSHGDDAPGQHQMPVQVVGVQHQDDGVGTLGAAHFAVENIHGYFFVFRLGIEAVDAREVDQRHLFARVQAKGADVVLHGDAGEISYSLPQSGEAIEQRGLARVWRADDGDRFVHCRAVLGLRIEDGALNGLGSAHAYLALAACSG